MISPIALLLSVVASSAAAGSTSVARDAEAKKLFRAGEHAYAAGEYLGAIRALEEAYVRTPLPAIAFSLAQANRMQFFVDNEPRRLARAVELYRVYIGATPRGERRADAVSLLAEIVPVLERRAPNASAKPVPTSADTQLLITCEIEGADVSIDGAKPKSAPLMANVAPGSHAVTVTRAGYKPFEQRAMAIGGALVVVEATLEPKPGRLDLSSIASGIDVHVDGRYVGATPLANIELPEGRHELHLARRGHEPFSETITLERDQSWAAQVNLHSSAQRKASYGVLAAAAGSLVATGIFCGLTLGADSDASALLDQHTSRSLSSAEAARYVELQDTRDARRTASFVLGGVTGALLVAGISMWFFDAPSPPEPN